MHQFNNPHQKDQFDKRNTFKGLTFQDYLDVIPEKYWSESKPYRNGVFFRCWNPEHDDPNPLCQECNETLERVLSQNSFRLKGKGWYKDGYSKGE